MRFVRMSLVVMALALCVVLLSPASASAQMGNCSTCSTASSGTSTANGTALTGTYNETGCDFPWGGTEDAVSDWLRYAIDDGTDAVAYFNQAASTCSCSAANAAIDKLNDAIYAAGNAVQLCMLEACQDNDACPYASFAFLQYQNALTAAQSCHDQACGASS